jgi:hypothetical protein
MRRRSWTYTSKPGLADSRSSHPQVTAKLLLLIAPSTGSAVVSTQLASCNISHQTPNTCQIMHQHAQTPTHCNCHAAVISRELPPRALLLGLHSWRAAFPSTPLPAGAGTASAECTGTCTAVRSRSRRSSSSADFTSVQQSCSVAYSAATPTAHAAVALLLLLGAHY